MKHHFLFGLLLAASCITGCYQKEKTAAVDPVIDTPPMAIVPESPDTLLANGRKNIFLVGRRNLPGLFVERSVFPSGYKSNPHTHPGNLNITVISGTFNLAFSSDRDSVTVTRIFGPGSFVIIPANQIHFEWFTETTVMDITGIGPIQTINLPVVHSSN